ncbi:transmembrane domain protein [Frog virus 3]|uniref:Transmembrane domain protein n=2 Tax=Frog virus 3 TaxID=10493 RepID=A0A5B8NZW2_FRG3V|nr:transmembrane domain protein [Frog virus 3]
MERSATLEMLNVHKPDARQTGDILFRILDSAGPQGQSSYTWEAKIAQVQHDMVAMINTFNQQIAGLSGTIMGRLDDRAQRRPSSDQVREIQRQVV